MLRDGENEKSFSSIGNIRKLIRNFTGNSAKSRGISCKSLENYIRK